MSNCEHSSKTLIRDGEYAQTDGYGRLSVVYVWVVYYCEDCKELVNKKTTITING